MSDDVFPSNDAEFDQFQNQFVSKVTPNPATYGLLPEDLTALQAEQASWVKDYAGHIKAQEDARTATQAKETTRGKYETRLRGAARKVHGAVEMNDATRVSVGLRPRDGTRSTIGIPTTRPLGRIESKGRLTLVLHFVDEETPTRLAKPHGVHGCQIWVYVGDEPPADATGYAFIALDTRTPYTHDHDAELAGKTAYYLLRWQNTKGEPGPWSEVVRAKIPL
jgi:hypothetical protein